MSANKSQTNNGLPHCENSSRTQSIELWKLNRKEKRRHQFQRFFIVDATVATTTNPPIIVTLKREVEMQCLSVFTLFGTWLENTFDFFSLYKMCTSHSWMDSAVAKWSTMT